VSAWAARPKLSSNGPSSTARSNTIEFRVVARPETIEFSLIAIPMLTGFGR